MMKRFGVGGWVVAAMLLGCEAPGPDTAERTAPAVAEPDFQLQGNFEEGQAIYVAQCASCHGLEGKGEGPLGAAFDPPPTDFVAVELDPARAYRVTRYGGMAEGMAATMPAFDALLDEQQLHDVVAYILQF